MHRIFKPITRRIRFYQEREFASLTLKRVRICIVGSWSKDPSNFCKWGFLLRVSWKRFYQVRFAAWASKVFQVLPTEIEFKSTLPPMLVKNHPLPISFNEIALYFSILGPIIDYMDLKPSDWAPENASQYWAIGADWWKCYGRRERQNLAFCSSPWLRVCGQ